ncbi:hypothetical protein BH20BAC1_BH20BAC1_28020 [soil metagenome]
MGFKTSPLKKVLEKQNSSKEQVIMLKLLKGLYHNYQAL